MMTNPSPAPFAPRIPLRQRGVVLIITLVMLVIISLLAALSIRNAASTEAVSGNVRTTELAGQSAEIALRYCEDWTSRYVRSTSGMTSATTAISFNVTVPATNPVAGSGGPQTISILGPQAMGTAPLGVNVANWDGVSTYTHALPLSEVNQDSPAKATYQRPPECMVEHMPVVLVSGTVDYTSTYLVTARGFGPEVAADNSRGRPTGSEIWLQSTITIEVAP